MNYRDEISELLTFINTNIVDFDRERTRGRMPTQVSSEFLTNKEQGDWAEKTLLDGINNNSREYIAVKYGRDDDIVAGEDGFENFYNDYQNELDVIGKRPDLLIFHKKDFSYKERNISRWSLDELSKVVPLAKCGIEVRSSAFLINKYENYMEERTQQFAERALFIKNEILTRFGDLLQIKDLELCKIIKSITADNLHTISFRARSWSSTEELAQLSDLLRDLKGTLSKITKRTFLGITPKVEDLKVVYNWIQQYNVPHYYVQVFFDKAYGISFEKILRLLGTPEKEGVDYFIEKDIKNQNKTTIKIRANYEAEILNKIYLPEHFSEMRELGRGRLLFYVKFKNSVSTIDKEQFKKLFGFELL